MRAVLLRKGAQGGHGRAELVEVPVPEPGRGEIVVEMKACGLCGTDIEKIRGEYTASMPVLGHEAVGVVSRVGDKVTGLKEGDRVFPHHHVSCGTCHYCRNGSETMCADYRRTNLDPGGFAEFFRVPVRNIEAGGVLHLPGALDFDLASLIEPVGCCLRAIDRLKVSGGDSALVVGAGPVGMMHALLLKWLGAEVIVSDVIEARLEFAEKHRLGNPVNAGTEDVPQQARNLTGGRGPDLAIVASGSPRALVQALKAVRKGGKVCIFGVPVKGSLLDYDIHEVFNSEIDIVTSYGATERETRKALKLLSSGKVDFRPVITDRFPLEDFAKGVEASLDGTVMKVLMTP